MDAQSFHAFSLGPLEHGGLGALIPLEAWIYVRVFYALLRTASRRIGSTKCQKSHF
jgi:hypothetical protein